MPKRPYHPKAYLLRRRNVKLGLTARSKILTRLEAGRASAKEMAKETGINYPMVLYHLKLLEAEGVVIHKGKKPYLWELTGLGQTRLIDIRT